MSHNTEPGPAATRHKPAIIAIVVALLVALVAFMVFQPGVDEESAGIATTAPPAGVTMSEADGRGEDVAPPVTPGADTPADAAGGVETTTTPPPVVPPMTDDPEDDAVTVDPVPMPTPIEEPRPTGGPIDEPAPVN